jgi:amidase
MHSVSGWSSRGGLTRNPYALDRTACGSSSGSGAAVAANLAAAAVGTETDGSIICPAQTNGIVGIKPTVGLVSRSGIIPIAHSQDTAGPMARCVADAAILLSALAGPDSRDPATGAAAARRLRDYRVCLVEHGLEGSRIGVARGLAGTDSRVLGIFESCLSVLAEAGAKLVDPVELQVSSELRKAEFDVLSFEFKTDLNVYLASRGRRSGVRSLEELIEFNEENRDRVMPYFGQENMAAAQSRGSLSSRAYRQALAVSRRIARSQGIDAVSRAHRLDAIVTPSGGPAWLIDLVNGDADSWDTSSTTIAAAAGYPHLTVPAGYVHGLPVGLSFFARAWREGTLIRLAYSLEQATRARRPPAFAAHADLGVDRRR